jgi:D-alanine-D-alanine ligase-like ATP-grasp enzyme
VRVTVVAGGESDERDVSRVSGTSVAAALRSAGHAVTVLDPARWPVRAVSLERVPERAPDEAEAAALADTFAGNLATPPFGTSCETPMWCSQPYTAGGGSPGICRRLARFRGSESPAPLRHL